MHVASARVCASSGTPSGGTGGSSCRADVSAFVRSSRRRRTASRTPRSSSAFLRIPKLRRPYHPFWLRHDCRLSPRLLRLHQSPPFPPLAFRARLRPPVAIIISSSSPYSSPLSEPRRRRARIPLPPPKASAAEIELRRSLLFFGEPSPLFGEGDLPPLRRLLSHSATCLETRHQAGCTSASPLAAASRAALSFSLRSTALWNIEIVLPLYAPLRFGVARPVILPTRSPYGSLVAYEMRLLAHRSSSCC